jgi:hypothetical protein
MLYKLLLTFALLSTPLFGQTAQIDPSKLDKLCHAIAKAEGFTSKELFRIDMPTPVI